MKEVHRLLSHLYYVKDSRGTQKTVQIKPALCSFLRYFKYIGSPNSKILPNLYKTCTGARSMQISYHFGVNYIDKYLSLMKNGGNQGTFIDGAVFQNPSSASENILHISINRSSHIILTKFHKIWTKFNF